MYEDVYSACRVDSWITSWCICVLPEFDDNQDCHIACCDILFSNYYVILDACVLVVVFQTSVFCKENSEDHLHASLALVAFHFLRELQSYVFSYVLYRRD